MAKKNTSRKRQKAAKRRQDDAKNSNTSTFGPLNVKGGKFRKKNHLKRQQENAPNSKETKKAKAAAKKAKKEERAKKKKTKNAHHALNLPPPIRRRPYRDMPWYNHHVGNDGDDKDNNDDIQVDNAGTPKPESQRTPPHGRIPLPTRDLPEQALEKLNDELLAFASYVRLRPVERHAREHIIQHITDLAGDLFQQQSSEGIRVQAFGSYATPDVCSFTSDVDLALWGVVAPSTHTTSDGIHDKGDKEQNINNNVREQVDDRPRKRQKQLSRWRQALVELDEKQASDANDDRKPAAPDAATAPPPAHGESQVSNETKSQVERQHPPPSNEPSPNTLFVIDRVGNTSTGNANGQDANKPNGVVEDEKKKENPGSSRGAIVDAANDAINGGKEEIDPLFAIDPKGDDLKERICDDADADPTHVDKSTNGSESDDEAADNDNVGGSVDTDNDSADKLESMAGREQKPVVAAAFLPVVSLSSSTSNSEDDDDGYESPSEYDDSAMEVSFHANATKSQGPSKQAAKLKGPVRQLVVSALKRLGRQLWKSPVARNVLVLHKARVPIITLTTDLGFEGDIAIGGHNGTDTSQFATTQVERFQSFAPVVLFLKVALAQQDLDKPFTGGLGSYRLYVMVAHHLERFLAIGGHDRPADVLMSFLFRFGNICNGNKISSHSQTLIGKRSIVKCDHGNGVADMEPVFKIEYCCEMFQTCWNRLVSKLQSNDFQQQESSYLGCIVNGRLLNQERVASLAKAAKLDRNTHTWIPALTSGGARKHQGKQAKQAQATWTQYGPASKQPSPSPKKQGRKRNRPEDASAEQLMAGYSLRRGPRGALIPTRRPDQEARQNTSILDQVVSRAQKRRKSKKKQGRDEGIVAIAQRFERR